MTGAVAAAAAAAGNVTSPEEDERAEQNTSRQLKVDYGSGLEQK